MSVDHYFDGLMVMGPRSVGSGKSAYDYAVEGGYLGTEAAFAERLAFLMNGTVVGYLEGSTVVLSGDLTPGTYTFAYALRKADGTTETVTIGTYTVEEETETYTITWRNYDGTVLEIDTVTEGEIPEYNGNMPARAADSQYTYTFNGWDKTVAAATADATYTATYTQTAKPVEPTTYTVTFVADGVTVATVSYEEGATSITEPAVPAKDGYTGVWESYTLNNTNITVNAVYTAIETGPTNFANPASNDWKTGCRLTTWIDQTTAANSLTGGVVTNYIEVKGVTKDKDTGETIPGDYIEVTGINFTDSNNRIAWDFGGVYGSISKASSISGESFSGLSYTANSFSATVAAPDSDKMQIRFSGVATNGSNGVVIHIKRDGEWL